MSSAYTCLNGEPEDHFDLQNAASDAHFHGSGHRPIKIPKDQLFQPPSGPWSIWNNSSSGLVSYCIYDAVDRLSVVFPPNSRFRSAQKTEVLTSVS